MRFALGKRSMLESKELRQAISTYGCSVGNYLDTARIAGHEADFPEALGAVLLSTKATM